MGNGEWSMGAWVHGHMGTKAKVYGGMGQTPSNIRHGGTVLLGKGKRAKGKG